MLILALLACATAIEGIAAGDGVAVCVAGQARTLNASAVYRNIHESMVRPLRDARHRVDVFLALAPTKHRDASAQCAGLEGGWAGQMSVSAV